jgi:hypothetical protein
MTCTEEGAAELAREAKDKVEAVSAWMKHRFGTDCPEYRESEVLDSAVRDIARIQALRERRREAIQQKKEILASINFGPYDAEYHAAMQSPAPLVSEQDFNDLKQIREWFDDGEGYGLTIERMQELAAIGLVNHKGRDYYEITEFGNAVLASQSPVRDWEEQ